MENRDPAVRSKRSEALLRNGAPPTTPTPQGLRRCFDHFLPLGKTNV
jgi:hypothetical protein